MTKNLTAFLEKEKQLMEKATPGPYHVERVDHDHDEITYEVSSPGSGFHVIFRESEAAEEGVCCKAQAEFYANAITSHEKAIEALRIATEALNEYVCPYCFHEDGDGYPECLKYSACTALASIEEVLK